MVRERNSGFKPCSNCPTTFECETFFYDGVIEAPLYLAVYHKDNPGKIALAYYSTTIKASHPKWADDIMQIAGIQWMETSRGAGIGWLAFSVNSVNKRITHIRSIRPCSSNAWGRSRLLPSTNTGIPVSCCFSNKL